MLSILQNWVVALPLRHQGVLVAAVRGCDGVPKRDPSKRVVAALRGSFMVPADARETAVPGSFMHVPPLDELREWLHDFARATDQYPLHFFLHVLHAAQVLGYEHPDAGLARAWNRFYLAVVLRMHLHPETREAMHARLTEDRVASGTVVDDWPHASGAQPRRDDAGKPF